MSDPDVAIKTDALTKEYSGRKVVDSIDLLVPTGTVFGFIGLNGAGKSTTIRMLTGRLIPTSGTMRVLGLDPVREEKALARRIGFLGDELGLYRDMSVQANLDFFGSLYDLPRSRTPEVIESMGLTEHAKKKVSALSKGLTQRARLAKAIMHDPELLFLDEPTVGLDIDIAGEIQRLIRSLAGGGKTIFLTTHNAHEIDVVSDRIGVLDHGRLISVMSMLEVRERTASDRVRVTLPDRELFLRMAELPSFLSANPQTISVNSEGGSSEDLFHELIKEDRA